MGGRNSVGWIGVDLDSTLALWAWEQDDRGRIIYDVLRIGPPIASMVDRVKALLAEGKDVRIFTARVGPQTDDECRNALDRGQIECGPLPQVDWLNYQTTLIETWCQEHLGQTLPITATKDFHMYLLYDDRCIQVAPNTGAIVQEVLQTQLEAALTRVQELKAQIMSYQERDEFPEGI